LRQAVEAAAHGHTVARDRGVDVAVHANPVEAGGVALFHEVVAAIELAGKTSELELQLVNLVTKLDQLASDRLTGQVRIRVSHVTRLRTEVRDNNPPC
jgi:hypothetical protein